MSMNSFSTDYLPRICQHYDLTEPAAGETALPIGSSFVHFEELAGEGQIMLATSVAHLQPENLGAVARLAAVGQAFFHATQGCTLAIAPDESFLALQRVLDLHALNEPALFAAIDAFVETAKLWEGRIAAIQTNGATAPQTSPAPLLPQNIIYG